jgi:polyphosphate kinase
MQVEPRDESPVPRAHADVEAQLINRDISDLAFVQRVLEEAENTDNPVLERARFLAITGMLLDEFYRIRVAALREQIRSGATKRRSGGLKPSKQLKQADKHSNRLIARQDRCWRALRRDLRTAGIRFPTPGKLGAREKAWLRSFFRERIGPELEPITSDIGPALASIRDGELLLLAEIAESVDSAHSRKAVVPIPTQIPRFVSLPGQQPRFVPIEWVIKAFLDELFPGGTVIASGLARVLREGNLKRFTDGDDLLRLVRDAIERREHADVIRLRVERKMPEHLAKALAGALGLLRTEEIKALEKSRRRATASEFVVADSFLGLADLSQLIDQLPEPFANTLLYPTPTPAEPDFLAEFGGDVLRAIAAGDRLLHFPYEDFGVLVKLLEQAATDDAVVAIRQTLYRTGRDSPIVRALAKAAERGKAVSVVVELEAREDESENVVLAEFLRAAGANVSFGIVDLKIHAKLLIIERAESRTIRSYVHCSTGNYEVASGHHYTDLCLLSADPSIAREAHALFAYARDRVSPERSEIISIAPLGLRERFTQLVEAEIEHALRGRPATIWLKVNKLSDEEIIRLLYRASQAGVDIDIIVRGICCLRPGIEGLSERIRVKSVVGRFLEHSRAFCFGNGHSLPSDAASVFISSADLMAHKLDRRVEALITIEDPGLKRRIQAEAFEAYFKDESNSWVLGPDDVWLRQATGGFNVQRVLSESKKVSA